MKKLMTLQNKVKTILEQEPETRDSDELLWLRTIESMSPEDIQKLNFSFVIRNVNYLSLPNYKSVCRARRKLQAKYPELNGSKPKRKFRAQNEERFIEYSRAEV